MATSSLQPEPQSSILRGLADALDASALANSRAAAVLRQLADVLPEAKPDDDPMMSLRDAAAYLGRSRNHVGAKCRGGLIRAMKDGADWRIRRSALDDYERKRTNGGRR